MSDQACIFCQIIRKHVPASIVYEDDLVLAFMDMRQAHPKNQGVLLTIL
jgi:histidine triad (HIT) family protein